MKQPGTALFAALFWALAVAGPAARARTTKRGDNRDNALA